LFQSQGNKINNLTVVAGDTLISIFEVPRQGAIIQTANKSYIVEFVVFVADPPPPQQMPIKLIVSEAV